MMLNLFGRTLKILLIDDDAFALNVLTRQLANLGYSDVQSYLRAQDALEQLQTDITFDVVFCDLQMPEMDGIEFVRQLVQLNYRGALALVSGEDARILQTAERLARGHQLDVLGTLSKPVANLALLDLLAKLERNVVGESFPMSKRYTARQLRQAIDSHQIINYYQPKVDLLSGMLVGVETLARWQHPDDGLIYPDQFICLAEDHGLIDDLTQTILINALRQGAVWHAKGLTVQVAVNISMDNLSELSFPDMVEHEADQAGLPLVNLTLEVTESRLMKDPLAALDNLTRLRLKRVGLSIDDFGTGHSSLAQLRDIPFTEFKIDRGFVHGASRDPNLQAILEANLAMAHQLDISVVAEGVELVDDWHLLRACGCDVAQGYLIAKPMPADDLPAWIQEWEPRRSELTTPDLNS